MLILGVKKSNLTLKNRASFKRKEVALQSAENLKKNNAMIQPYEGGDIKFALSATGKDGKLHIMIMENMSLTTFIYNYLCLLLKQHKN